MIRDEKEKLLVSMGDIFPESVRFSNLVGNKAFIEWLVPVVNALRESDFWDIEIIHRIQEERLRNFLVYLNAYSPIWKEHFLNYGINFGSPHILEEIKQLPVMNRQELQSNRPIMVGDRGYYTRYTTGTTGMPVPVVLNEKESLASCWTCFFRPSVISEDMIPSLIQKLFIIILGYDPPHYGGCGRFLLCDEFSKLSEKSLRYEIYKAVKDAASAVISGHPSLILELASYFSEDKISLPLLAMYSSGEAYTNEEKKIIRDAYKVPIIDRYGTQETTMVGIECPSHFGESEFHTCWERAIIEVVDENGQETPIGKEGNVLITVLDRTTTPVVRYWNGDRGVFLGNRCKCGRTSPKFQFRGREKHSIIFPDGRKYGARKFTGLFLDMLHRARIRQFQIVQTSISNIDISIVPIDNIPSQEKNLLSVALSSVLENKISVNIIQVDEIKRTSNGKLAEFIPLT